MTLAVSTGRRASQAFGPVSNGGAIFFCATPSENVEQQGNFARYQTLCLFDGALAMAGQNEDWKQSFAEFQADNQAEMNAIGESLKTHFLGATSQPLTDRMRELLLELEQKELSRNISGRENKRAVSIKWWPIFQIVLF